MAKDTFEINGVELPLEKPLQRIPSFKHSRSLLFLSKYVIYLCIYLFMYLFIYVFIYLLIYLFI